MTDETDDEYNPNIESYQDYRERITMMADMIEEHLEDDPDAELSELVFEEVDGSRMAIYTHEAINALKHHDEGIHEWKHLVSDDDSWQKVITALAFEAVRNDLYAELDRLGVQNE